MLHDSAVIATIKSLIWIEFLQIKWHWVWLNSQTIKALAEYITLYKFENVKLQYNFFFYTIFHKQSIGNIAIYHK